VTAGTIPLCRRWLRNPSWLDLPREDRHHRRPVSKTGSVGWMAGALAALLLSLPWPVAVLLGVALALAFVLGRADDLGRLRPGVKWILQTALLLGSWAALRALGGGAAGVSGGFTGSEFGPSRVLPPLLVALCLQTALEIFDNLDGALGLAACAGLMSVSLAAAPGWTGAAAGAGAGACLGFLLWNRPPAAVHLGNAGSYPVALFVALLVLETLLPARAGGVASGSVGARGAARWAVLLPLAWPLFDFLFVTAARILRGVPPWRGGRDHTTHRLARALGSDGAAAAGIAVGGGLGLRGAIRIFLGQR
jgi:UDP-GlcNAc:undecaprenyl-phosphate/decaprenyl-phosphate GlcNAc-1-phosphate transferase